MAQTNLIFQKKHMAIKGWPVSVMYLPHVSNNGHQGVASFRYVPISCE